MMNTRCSTQDLTMANGIAIGCATYWRARFGGRACVWRKDKNDGDGVFVCANCFFSFLLPRVSNNLMSFTCVINAYNPLVNDQYPTGGYLKPTLSVSNYVGI